MGKEDFKNDLARLRAEIDRMGQSSPESQSRLDRLVADLESRIDNLSEEDHQGMLDNLGEEIRHFETEHPRATAILNDIMVTLSNMGI
jgi:hypothetical protein